MNQTINNMSKTKTKTIFKGVINGVEFDNVADYNKRLTELLAAGENVNASTSTSTVDICDCCGKVASECTCEDACEKPLVNMLPGFESKEAIENYVDKFVTDNDLMDKHNMDSYTEYLKENFEGIKREVAHMDKFALESYRDDLNEVMDIIDEDLCDTLESIHRKEVELKTLHKAKEVLLMWNETYKNYLALVNDKVNTNKTNKDEDGSQKVEDRKRFENGMWNWFDDCPVNRIVTEEECKQEARAAQEARAKELENTLIGAVNSLLEAFGVKK
jgi:hypothetical protein